MFYTIDDLNEIRETELDLLLQKHGKIFSGATVLEVGAGNGGQLATLRRTAEFAVGVDVLASNYHPDQTQGMVYYDGVNLPFAGDSFDVIYSSNTMEHVLDEPALHKEMMRVLRPEGVAVHVVPSSTWRIWTVATYYIVLPRIVIAFLRRQSKPPKHADAKPRSRKSASQLLIDLVCPARHGETGNRFTEWWHFRGASWKRRFEGLGWNVESTEGIGLFYTGYLVSARWLPIAWRQSLARLLGSSCLIFVLRPGKFRSLR